MHIHCQMFGEASVCVCMCVCLHVCMCVLACVHVCACVCIRVHVQMCTSAYALLNTLQECGRTVVFVSH